MSTEKKTEIKNPCVRVCGYDDNNMCIYCFRTKKEIFYWGDFTNEEKKSVIKLYKERKQAHLNKLMSK